MPAVSQAVLGSNILSACSRRLGTHVVGRRGRGEMQWSDPNPEDIWLCQTGHKVRTILSNMCPHEEQTISKNDAIQQVHSITSAKRTNTVCDLTMFSLAQ